MKRPNSLPKGCTAALTGISAALALQIIAACSSIPKDAPVALHEAATELKTAKEIKTNKLLPKTITTSEEQLDESIAEFEKVPKAERASTDWAIHNSVIKATQVKERVQKANAIRRDITEIDGRLDSLEGMATISSLSREVADLREKLTGIEKGSSAEQARLSMLSKIPLHGPTVYFDTNEATISERDQAALRELAKTMKDNPDLKLKLVGFADPRGSADYNQNLSMRRAAGVQAFLTSAGMDAKQVAVEALGSTTAFYKTNLEKLQLERRVEMMLLPR